MRFCDKSGNGGRRAVWLAAGSVAIALSAGALNQASGALIASDIATNAAYTNGSSFNGINGGTNWGSAWSVTSTGGGSGTITNTTNNDPAGYQYKIPVPNFDITSPSGTSSTTGTTATRSFSGNLAVGQTFSFEDMLVNGTAGWPIGFKLQDSTGAQLLDVHATGGAAYSYTDSTATNATLGTVPYNYTKTDMWRFTLLDTAGDYSLTTVWLDGSNNVNTTVTTGKINNTNGIAKFSFYNNNSGGSFTDFQINQLSVAQPIYTGGAGNWNTPANWTQTAPVEAGVPASGNAIQFSGAGGASNNNLTANTLINGMTFNSGAGAYTISGNALNLGFDIVNNSANAQAINTPMALTRVVNVNAASANVALGGAISGTGGITATGGNTITITGSNSYTGGTTVGTGTLNFTSGGLGTAGNVAFTGGTLQYGTSNTQDLSGRIAGSTSPVTIDTHGNNVNYSSALASTNTAGLTKTGSGVLTISAPAAYGGATNITGGTLQLGAAPTSLQSVGGIVPALHIDASSLSAGAITTLTNTGSGGGTFGGTGTIVASGLNGHSVLSLNGSSNVFTSTNAYTLNGNQVTIFIAENQLGRGQQYAGEMSFIGAPGGTDWNTTGNFAVDSEQASDTIKIESNGNFASINRPATGTADVWDTNINAGTDNAKLFTTATATSNTPATASGSGLASFNVNQTAIGARYSSGSANGNYWQGYIGEILVFNASLTTAQQNSVEQYLNYKWLGVGSSSGIPNGSLPTGTPVTMSGGGTLDLNGLSQSIGSLSSSDPTTQVTLGSGALTTGSDGTNTAFAGSISGTGTLTKTGGGAFTLSGSNSYQGGTTLSTGTLVASNTTGSATGSGTVKVSGGTLASGTVGTISGPVTPDTVSGGAYNIAPGGIGSIGTLNLGSTLALNSNSTLNFDINGSTDDQLDVTGAVSILSGTPHIALSTSGTLSGTYTLANFASSVGLSNSSFSLPTAPTGYAWHVSTTSIMLAPTIMRTVSLTTAGVASHRGSVTTSGASGSYVSTVFDEAGNTGDVNGYIDVNGTLPTPSTDTPVDVLVDLEGSPSDIASLLTSVSGSPSAGFAVYYPGNDPNGTFAQVSSGYNGYVGPDGAASWDAVFVFNSLPSGASPGDLKFNWDFTGTNVTLDKAVVVPEPTTSMALIGLTTAGLLARRRRR
jgi:autotransporter-associated beta strand protein